MDVHHGPLTVATKQKELDENKKQIKEVETKFIRLSVVAAKRSKQLELEKNVSEVGQTNSAYNKLIFTHCI